jgi:uncharacterized membrane protein YphA (DoxX/SURF4 family)
MFYRVDYALAVLLAGLVAGFLFSRAAAGIAPSRMARAYYVVVAILVVLVAGGYLASILTGRQVWYFAGAFCGDLEWFWLGALFGLALRRSDARELLLHPSVLSAVTLSIAFMFVLLGVGKSFNMQPMTEFFTQSGYSVTFLKFIIMAEILGGLGLLLPWGFLPAWFGLTVDMFGAVLTHMHNGDSLNDSTDAVKMLSRLAVAGVLWAMRPQAAKSPRSARGSLVRVGAAMTLCLIIAAGGSIVMRSITRHSPPAVPSVSK